MEENDNDLAAAVRRSHSLPRSALCPCELLPTNHMSTNLPHYRRLMGFHPPAAGDKYKKHTWWRADGRGALEPGPCGVDSGTVFGEWTTSLFVNLIVIGACKQIQTSTCGKRINISREERPPGGTRDS